MPRPITAVIHTQALRQNLEVLRASVPNSKVFAVVKANAYGHGIERVYESFKTADGFALLDIEEATTTCTRLDRAYSIARRDFLSPRFI